jgi:hypothetical protein
MSTRLVLLALLLASASALAAPLISERSAVNPGLWWDPQQSGQGIDIHVSGETVFVLWYTYRVDGSPIWYSAAGQFDEEGLLVANWREHHWQQGQASDRLVGELRMHRENPERIQLDWQIHGRHGELALQPLPLASVLPEIDHSGAWYEPARSGYGLTIAERGDWLALAYYFYDDRGEPTWLLGHNDGAARKAVLSRFSGPCPGCPARPLTSEAVADATLRFAGDQRLEIDIELHAAGVPAAFRHPAQPMQMLSAPSSQRPADRQLARFDDEPQLLATLRQLLLYGAQYREYSPGPILSPPPATASPVSTTNLVEQGVDEAGLLKSDGRYVYTFAADQQEAPAQLRIAEILAGPSLQMHPPVSLASKESRGGASRRSMYVLDDALVTLRTDAPSYWIGPGILPIRPPDWWAGGSFHVELFDRSVPAQPAPSWQAEIDGYLVASRRIGEQLYLIHRSAHLPASLQRSAGIEAFTHNRAVLDGSDIADLMPRIRIGNGDPQPLLGPAHVLLPPIGNRRPMPEFAVVTRINLRDPDDRESMALLGGVETVYVSPQSIYIATSRYQPSVDAGALRWPGGASTQIHQFELGSDGLRVAGSGVVEGVINRDADRAPFRFSEHEGHLRVMTEGEFGDAGRNHLSVLKPSNVTPGLLNVVAQLPNAQRRQAIGKPNEELYGTRFVGDRLYAVTFLNIDPLYVIDLADPTDPKILGELELPGFSEYLHPLADGLLLGIGLDASPATGWGDGRFAWFQGLQIALFDVADPGAPQVVDRRLLGERGSGSAALGHHHAFSGLSLQDGRFRFAIPARIHGERFPQQGGTGTTQASWRESGLFAFDVVGQGAQARLQPLEPLITRRPPASAWPDAAGTVGRSLLTPEGVIYVEQGDFWVAPWSGTATPVGPR